jgi:hypothetical protein
MSSLYLLTAGRKRNRMDIQWIAALETHFRGIWWTELWGEDGETGI